MHNKKTETWRLNNFVNRVTAKRIMPERNLFFVVKKLERYIRWCRAAKRFDSNFKLTQKNRQRIIQKCNTLIILIRLCLVKQKKIQIIIRIRITTIKFSILMHSVLAICIFSCFDALMQLSSVCTSYLWKRWVCFFQI